MSPLTFVSIPAAQRRRMAGLPVSAVLRLDRVGLGAASVSFSAYAGDIVHLGGGSPMARLRLLAMAAGFAQVGSGRCEILGQEVLALDDPHRRALRDRHIARVLSCDPLPAARTVLDSVAMPLLRQGMAASAALKRAGMELDALGAASLAARQPALLSRGETRLALLARAVAMRPRLLVVEQPEAALEPSSVAAVRLAMQTLAGSFDTCVVMTTEHPGLMACADCHIDLDRDTPLGQVLS